MPIAPDVPYEIGQPAFGGYAVGVIDTTQGNIDPADASQTGARYLLIISPASLRVNRQWRTSNGTSPAATKTRWDGLTATAAIDSFSYPAGQYCAGLSRPADQGSDWYLPALDELELIYRNLKPTAESNSTGTESFVWPASHPHGENPSSDPPGAAYTATDPAQTSATLFREGEAQAMGNAGSNNWHWTSTQAKSSNSVWQQSMSGYGAGQQDGSATNQTSNFLVRPVRRVLVSDLNNPPNAPLVSDQGPFNRAAVNRVVWQHSDPDHQPPTQLDPQSAAELLIDPNGAATLIEIPNPNQFWDSPPGTWVADVTPCKVRTADQAGAWGPWSPEFFITAGDAPPGATITAPVSGAIIPTSTVTVDISAENVDEAEYRLYADDGAGNIDLETELQPAAVKNTGDVRSHTWTGLANNVPVWLWVRIKHDGLWSVPTTQRNPVSYTPPPTPAVTWAEPDPAPVDLRGVPVPVVDYAIANPAPAAGEPAVVYNDVYLAVRDHWGTLLGWKRRATMVPPNGTWRYWSPPNGFDAATDVRVVAVGDNQTTTTTEGAGEA